MGAGTRKDPCDPRVPRWFPLLDNTDDDTNILVNSPDIKERIKTLKSDLGVYVCIYLYSSGFGM